jgi:hypothetical protein
LGSDDCSPHRSADLAAQLRWLIDKLTHGTAISYAEGQNELDVLRHIAEQLEALAGRLA